MQHVETIWEERGLGCVPIFQGSFVSGKFELEDDKMVVWFPF